VLLWGNGRQVEGLMSFSSFFFFFPKRRWNETRLSFGCRLYVCGLCSLGCPWGGWTGIMMLWGQMDMGAVHLSIDLMKT
jgi:hypothetical protein